MKTVKLRGVEVGAGMPKVIVPIVVLILYDSESRDALYLSLLECLCA